MDNQSKFLLHYMRDFMDEFDLASSPNPSSSFSNASHAFNKTAESLKYQHTHYPQIKYENDGKQGMHSQYQIEERTNPNNFQSLKINNFGENNASKIVRFDSDSPNVYAADQIVYQALQCLFNPNYADYRVTKYGENPDNNSYVQIKLHNPKFKIKRMLNSSRDVYVSDCKIDLNDWKQYVACLDIVTFEPPMTSAESFVKAQVVEIVKKDNEMATKSEELLMLIANVDRDNLDATDEFTESLLEDLRSDDIIRASSYLKMEEHHNHCKAVCKEMRNLPNDKAILNKLWNISIATMQSSTAKMQEESCSQAIQKINENIQANTDIFNTRLLSFNEVARIDKLLIENQRNERLKIYGENLMEFYTHDDTFVQKYFHQRDAVEILNDQKRDNEEHLSAMEEWVELLSQNKVAVTREIDNLNEKIQRMVDELDQRYEYESDHIFRGFEAIQNKYINDDCIYSAYGYVCEMLNNERIEYTAIKPFIGLLHAVNLNVHRGAYFLFEDLNLNTHPKSSQLQFCLASLSSVLYYEMHEEAYLAQITLMEEEGSDFDTKFVLAGLDTLQLNMSERDGRIPLCKDLNIAYSVKMMNLLSQLSIHRAGGDASYYRMQNWDFNSDTNILHAEGQEMFAFEPKKLFELLRILKQSYTMNQDKIRDSYKLIHEIMSASQAVYNNKLEIYRIETSLLKAELELRNARYRLINLSTLVSSTQYLISRSKCRLINYDKLLHCQDGNVRIDEEAFTQTASQQTTNILDRQDISREDISTARLMFAADVIHPNNRSLQITNETQMLSDLLEIWQQHMVTAANENDVVREDDVRRRLDKYVNADFGRMSYFLKERSRLNKLHAECRSSINHFRNQNDDIDRRIDVEIMKLRYPKAGSRDLSVYGNQLLRVVPNRKNAMKKMIKLLLQNQADSEQNMSRLMQEISNGLSMLMKHIHNSHTINVRCELLKTSLNNVDWTRHMNGRLPTLRNIHFQLTDGVNDIQHNSADDMYLAIGFYLCMASFYTRNIIVLHDALKMLSQGEKAVVCSISNLLKRFILICTNERDIVI